MGKAPRECGVRAVARHAGRLPSRARWCSRSATPTGSSCSCRLADGAEILVRREGGGAVTALAWNANGARLVFGTDDGRGGASQSAWLTDAYALREVWVAAFSWRRDRLG